MYATQADMLCRFGLKEVLALTDREFSGQIDAAQLDQALQAASDEIDGYLAGRYTLPFIKVPGILMGYACDIARYRLCGAETIETELIRQRYRDAIRFLELVAAGKVSLGGMPDGAAPATNQSVQFTQSSKVFARGAGAY